MARVVSIDEIEEGMINLEPIVNRYGQTLLGAGAVLTRQHSNMLKTWNIRNVRVKGEEEYEDITISDEIKEMLLKKIRKRANWLPKNNIEKDLFAMTILHYSKQYMRQGVDEK